MKTGQILFIGALTFAGGGMALAAPAFTQALQAGAPSGAPVTDARTSARRALEERIKTGMTLAAFRRIALAQGWAPIPHTPPCLNQVDAGLCAQLPELYDTSSGPIEYNQVSYRHLLSGEAIAVTATGEIGRWNKPREESEVIVDSWRFFTGDVQN